MVSTFAQANEVSDEYKKKIDEGAKAYLDLIKNAAVSLFVQKYSTIVNCIKIRQFMGQDTK